MTMRQRNGDAGTAPPVVPPQFWETAEMQAALRSRHMGKVIRAYRHHQHHGYLGLTQSDVAKWAGISQGQVSRLETGRPMMRLDQLIHWALLLSIPQRHLWFDLPDPDDVHPLNGWSTTNDRVAARTTATASVASIGDGVVGEEEPFRLLACHLLDAHDPSVRGQTCHAPEARG